MKCLGLHTALPSGRTECAPPKKNGISRRLPASAQLDLLGSWPRRGGAGSARPLKNAWASPGHLSVRPRAFGHPSRVMERPGMSKAWQPGRGDRAPPRKPPLEHSRGLTSQGRIPSAWPRRGGAGSARPRGWLALDRGMCPLGHRAIVNACIRNVRPRHSCGRTTRTRGAHPFEKTALRLPVWGKETRWGRERLGLPFTATSTTN
jgi:hypothetical protein